MNSVQIKFVIKRSEGNPQYLAYDGFRGGYIWVDNMKKAEHFSSRYAIKQFRRNKSLPDGVLVLQIEMT